MAEINDYEDDAAEDARVHSIESAMAAAGESTEERVQADYFGFDETHVVTLPDGQSAVYHKTLNEGSRRKYQNALNKDVRLKRGSGDAIMRLSPGDEKKELLTAALVDWNLKRGGQPVPFSPKSLAEFLDKANPKVIDLIEKDIRKKNSWLQSEMSVEDIDREIESLQEIRQSKVESDEGKGYSSKK